MSARDANDHAVVDLLIVSCQWERSQKHSIVYSKRARLADTGNPHNLCHRPLLLRHNPLLIQSHFNDTYTPFIKFHQDAGAYLSFPFACHSPPNCRRAWSASERASETLRRRHCPYHKDMQLFQLRRLLSHPGRARPRCNERLACRLCSEATPFMQGTPAALGPLIHCVVAYWQEQENFDIVLRDRHVVASLNDLDRLVDDARSRRAKARDQAAAAGQPVQQPIPYECLSSHHDIHPLLIRIALVPILCLPLSSTSLIWLRH